VKLSVTETGPSIASVLGSASFQPGISSGSWFSVFGTNLAQTTRLWQASDFTGNKLPTQLDGVWVFINGKPAPVYYVSPAQVNALAPDDSALGPVSVEVVTSQGRSTSMLADKRTFAPAWFMFDAEARRYLAGVHPDGAYLGKTGLYSGLNMRPAKPGGIVMLYGTGFGPVNPATPSDQLVTQPGRLTSSVIVRIGGVAAGVQWAGLVSPGLYQFNVVVPNVSDGDQAVTAEIGGASSQTGAFITVRR
jgi:uncharacterized protein (TIGR03437 family)